MLVVGVEFSSAGKIYDFLNPDNLELKKGDAVVVQTQRGVEVAFVVQNNKQVEENNYEYKPIIRLATEQDLINYEKNKQRAKKDYKAIQELIYFSGMQNKLADVEFVLDGSKIIVSIVSENRVDFRSLIKKLTEKYRCKIEIKLIGSRDELKIKGAIGPCGRECCCASHKREFDKISIKMAKKKNLSLSPTKINGACGKLMCCLSYENEEYTRLASTMPKINQVVQTPSGEGLVVYNDLFNQKCTVRIPTEDNSFKNEEFEVKDVKFDKEWWTRWWFAM